MLSVAAIPRCGAALRVNPLNVRDAFECALSLVRFRLQQQPGDVAWTRNVGALLHLTHHLAAVVSFPSRAGVMPADLLPLVAYQVGLRSLQNPLELVSVPRLCAARVDLNSLAHGLQQHPMTVGHLQVVWNGRPLD